ncbi:hypothetical protein DFH08DRAFT_165444 [Mycena albidolilacea]|uniref:Uncharacterized protein n=1 Tax=Mycena albidolilacea TaxID=1033008 RepID=A0AAD7F2Z5_9AGAR|nr:hypothetical protein DFH08DRAFT_165444 [Mycena albidolilacea]
MADGESSRIAYCDLLSLLSFSFRIFLPTWLSSFSFWSLPRFLRPPRYATPRRPPSLIIIPRHSYIPFIHFCLDLSPTPIFFSRHSILIFPFWLPSFLARFVSSAFLCLYDLTPTRR